jgi:enoyl-CoA hydratase
LDREHSKVNRPKAYRSSAAPARSLQTQGSGRYNARIMSTVNLTIADGIARLSIARPEARNAINAAVRDEFSAHLDRLSQDDSIRSLIVSGEGGKALAAGADISELLERTHRDAFFAANAAFFQRVEDFPRPTVAAIEGYALGGGLELALACDIRVAGRGAKLGLPEVTLGIFPAAGGTWRLPRIVGLGRARELIFTGRVLSAEEAREIGLVEHVVDDGRALDRAMDLCRKIGENSPLAVQVAKTALNAAARGADPSSIEKLGQALLFDSPDKRARMTAFLEKKKRS